MVSVIIPNYNHSSFLEERINSVLNQTYTDFEVLILDDCSTDSSRAVIEPFRRHSKIAQIVYNEANSGSTFLQWIRGIDLAKGDFIWIAESDDLCSDLFLERCIGFLMNKDCALSFTRSRIIDSNNRETGVFSGPLDGYTEDFVLDGKRLIEQFFCKANLIPNASAVVFRRGLFTKEIARELIKFKINGDWFLWINLLLNKPCAYIPEPLNSFRRYNSSGSRKNIENFRNIEESMMISRFLQKKKFRSHGIRWIKAWISQANYNLITLFRSNFFPIYKRSFRLFPLPMTLILALVIAKKVRSLGLRISNEQ